MSFKAKNLTYESNEPAFLRKLRREYAGGSDPARHQHPLARPRKQHNPDGEDDEPTYVHEDTLDTISKDEYDALLMHKKGNDPTSPSLDEGRRSEDAVSESTGEQLRDVKPAEQLQANIGSTSKKRLVRAIGDQSEVREHVPDGDGPHHQKANRNKTKRKKIKLSFEEEAET